MKNYEIEPKYKRFRHNDYYLGLIHNLYAGNEGEVCSYLQFMYQVNQNLLFNTRLANIFFDIANDEMKHQMMLGEIITILNGNPTYTNSQGKWLSGRNVDYVKDLKSLLEINLETKNKMIIDYKTAIAKIDDFEIKKTLNEILESEKTHANILREELKKLEN